MHARPRSRPRAAFHGILAALVLALCGLPALAVPLSVGDLRLEYGPPWQRADAEEEARADGYILRRSDGSVPLTVMLPKHQARLRMPEERFYRQLETVWRAQYGATAAMSWLEAGGRRWRMLRRPSVESGDRVVFHLVTVIDERAHHLLVHAPAAVDMLPEAALTLLSAPVDAPETMPTPGPAMTAQGAHWRLDRVLRIHPGQTGLDRLMTLERQGLKGEGGITGVVLQVQEHGLRASLQGFVWVPGPNRREVRREWTHGWELSWTAPPRLWRDDEAAAIVVSSAAAGDRIGVEIGLRPLCGPADRLRELLDDVERGQGDASERLEAVSVRCRGRATGRTRAEIELGAGETARPILIEPPDPSALDATEQGLLVLSLQPRGLEGKPGQALLGAASVHYVYVRGR